MAFANNSVSILIDPNHSHMGLLNAGQQKTLYLQHNFCWSADAHIFSQSIAVTLNEPIQPASDGFITGAFF